MVISAGRAFLYGAVRRWGWYWDLGIGETWYRGDNAEKTGMEHGFKVELPFEVPGQD